uniref:Urease accessory protein UreH-like transmembrane domain-containing protein n=1 Tax=Kalanchoe fedtschenkoi TaxID=63787 RepID=A0A7N0T0U4_KALFE
MERLIHSSSPTKLVDLRHTSAFRLPQIFKLSSSAPQLPKRVNLVCCSRELPPSVLTTSAVSAEGLVARPGCSDGSGERSALGVRIEENAVLLRKIGAFGGILVSALIAVLVPILAQPALATLQSAASGGGSAVGRGLASAEFLSSAWTGFLAGCLHTLSGPDHLAALAPLSIGRTRLQSAAVGALWGAGHDAGQVIFGLLFLLLKDRLQIEIFRTWGTRVVGLTLMVIGAMGIKEAYEVPAVALETGDASLLNSNSINLPGKKKIGFATFATGVVHGLQPDALMIVLPALALPSRLAGAAFLGMFLLGTVFSMGSYTAFLGSCSQALKERVPRITEKLTWASSLIAVGLGLAIIISQFFGFNLY